MSDTADSDRRSNSPQEDQGVLANLPRARPQRSSPRRAAARKATAGAQTGTAATAPPRPSARSKIGVTAAKGRPRKPTTAKAPAGNSTRSKAKRPKDSARSRESVPRQGFESESDAASGPVQPPGGVELVTSAAEIVGELAKAGLSSGERLLKDLFTRLPRP